MAEENHSVNKPHSGVEQPDQSVVDEQELPSGTLFASAPAESRPSPKSTNPFDLPDGKQVQKPYDHNGEKEVIVEEYQVGSKDAGENGAHRKRRVVCGCISLSLLAILSIVAVVVVMVIALGTGLGVGLKKYVLKPNC
jgi:hypothetical protein